MQDESQKLGEVKVHILLLGAAHPELQMPSDAQQLVDDFKKSNPNTWAQAQQPNRDVADAWDARMRLEDDPVKLQEELDSLAT